MTIKVAPRAQITPEFTGKLREIYQRKFDAIKTELDHAPNPYYRRVVGIKKGNALARMTNLLKNPASFDLEVTRLRSLEYTHFWLATHYNPVAETQIVYLAGRTKPIRLSDDLNHWDLGIYQVFFPVTSFETGTWSGLHMIPEADAKTRCRHPHHKATYPSYCNDRTELLRSPLDMSPSTCTGGFGEILLGTIQDADVPELFRSISVYLSRYNPHSPLVPDGIRSVTFARRVVG